ncbi:hypothetical protein VQ042_05970 [Aurantimonas sp. A2-1-M11]|uniref:hypothetical protein n=1 Tax=Aurantimonas sp. A2-1-M11 TaxID=3113712 RepID=UPI002F930DCD
MSAMSLSGRAFRDGSLPFARFALSADFVSSINRLSRAHVRFRQVHIFGGDDANSGPEVFAGILGMLSDTVRGIIALPRVDTRLCWLRRIVADQEIYASPTSLFALQRITDTRARRHRVRQSSHLRLEKLHKSC